MAEGQPGPSGDNEEEWWQEDDDVDDVKDDDSVPSFGVRRRPFVNWLSWALAH